jgi:hypothetical protein
MRTSLLLIMLWMGALLPAQPPHDRCSQALTLEVGQTLNQEDNRLASITPDETPHEAPRTCIRTYENDLWYQFTTEAPYQYYSIEVDPLACESPAGLQMLLIKADTCDPDSFSYTACLNPYETEPLELFWENPFPGEHYFIHVDGYDGNICQFRLTLKGHQEDPRSLQDLTRMRYDPDHPEPTFTEAGLISRFENNEVVLNWQAESREEVAFFLIERVWTNAIDGSLDGSVVARVQPTNTVGTDLMTEYQHIISRRFPDEQELCFQVVKVSPALTMNYARPTCVTTDLITDFFISEVYAYETGPPDTYAVKYVNRKRQNLEFSLYNEAGKYLKGYIRKREPRTDGVITIDMSGYPPGRYRLEVEGRRGTYRRPFYIE